MEKNGGKISEKIGGKMGGKFDGKICGKIGGKICGKIVGYGLDGWMGWKSLCGAPLCGANNIMI